MSATYEIYLTDDSGRRILLLDKTAFFSYSRVINGFGTAQVGMPYREFRKQVWPVFVPDRRLEIWRSADIGIPMRLEGVYFLREPKIYTREEDNLDMIELFGRSPIDLLHRRWIVQAAGTSFTSKTDHIDDMMKAIVRDQMLWGFAYDAGGDLAPSRAYPAGEFTVQADLSLGPSVSMKFADRNVLDVLKELRDLSFQKNEEDPTNRKIYFDIVPATGTTGQFAIYQELGINVTITDELGNDLLDESSNTSTVRIGFQFQTFADLRGVDRRDKLVFSVANSNLKGPWYQKSHFEERTSIIVKGTGRGESRATATVTDTERSQASRWNTFEEIFEASYEVDASGLPDVGAAQLRASQPVEELFAVFLNTPGSENVPRSLYSIDWDLGDLVRVWFADMAFDCEIVVVYVGVDEKGVETITGRNTVEGVE